MIRVPSTLIGVGVELDDDPGYLLRVAAGEIVTGYFFIPTYGTLIAAVAAAYRENVFIAQTLHVRCLGPHTTRNTLEAAHQRSID